MEPKLTPHHVDILLVLAPGPLHGYAIMKAVDALHGQSKKLGAARLYNGLQFLSDHQLIEELMADDPRRRPFRLTYQGHQAISQVLSEKRQYLERAQRLLGGQERLA